MLPPSSQRALPLIRRADLQLQEIDVRGDRHFVVKDPVGLAYFRLIPLQHRILMLLDGERSLDGLLADLHAEPEFRRIDVGQVRQIVFDLHEKGLVWSSRPGTVTALFDQQQREFAHRWRRRLSSLLFIRLPGWNARWLLACLTDVGGWLFSPLMLIVSLAYFAATGLFLLSHVEEFQRQLPSLDEILTGQNLLTLWFVVGSLKIVHEFGHGIACRRFGGECQTIGLAFLIFSPCLYCDVTDAWMLKRRAHRLLISAAGIYVELLIAATAVWLWWHSAPGLFHSICLQVFLVGSASTLLFNANPLLRYDGYYILEDLIGVPNLQGRSQRAIQETLCRTVLGVQAPPDALLGQGTRLGYLAYGLSSGLYRWVTVFGIGMFLYAVLEPYGLHRLAYLYGLVSVLGAIGMTVSMGWTTMRTHGSASNAPWRMALTAGCAAGLGWLVCQCPVPFHPTAPLILEPLGIQHVYTESPGELGTLLVREGDVVQKGQTLAELHSLDFDRRITDLEGQILTHQTDHELSRAISDPDLDALSREGIQTVSHQLEQARTDLQRLTIQAPLAGRILSAPIDEQRTAASGERLPGRPATPLSESRLQSHVPRRTHLCSIAPGADWQAVLWVDQEEVATLRLHQSIPVRLEAWPDETFTGEVIALAPAADDAVPVTLSKKAGGELTTQTAESGETTIGGIYRVTLRLDDASLPFRVGMRGTGQLANPTGTIGAWLLRAFHRTFTMGVPS